MALCLQKMGCETCEAYNGAEALVAGADYLPSLVLLDLSMPVMDGYEACRIMRAAPWGKSIPIIALTGWDESQVRQKTQACGFDMFLMKPLDRVSMLQLAELGIERPGAGSLDQKNG
ncbi:MAG: response regulator [Flavobacteriales bacterium]|nr:response regulator [Flavobacteriales bacterium]